MWVTQTYLKSPEPDAKLHLYYLFDAHNDHHVAATERAQEELVEFSRSVPEACILFPNERSEAEIYREQKHQGLLKKFKGALPGVLGLRTPLEKLNVDSDEVLYVQLNHEGFSDERIEFQSERFTESLKQLMQITVEQMEIVDRKPSVYEKVPLALRLWRTTEISIGFDIGILCFSISAKKLFEDQQD